MGVNDELTPAEHGAMRETLLAGARRIKPAGAHRTQIIAASVALVLVAGVAGGTLAAANLFGAKEIPPVTTPTPTATSTPSPTPTPTPTVDPAELAGTAALGGVCSSALSTEEVDGIVGPGLELRPIAVPRDVSLIGGLSCSWQSRAAVADSDWRFLDVRVFPASVVPADVLALSSVESDCMLGGCEYSEVHGDAWVLGTARTMEQAVAAVRFAGPRAAADPGRAADRSPLAWTNITCDLLDPIPGEVLSRTDFGPYVGDSYPHGQEWSVMVQNNVAAWCALMGEGEATLMEQVSFSVGPGAGSVDPESWAETPPVPTTVAGASTAWVVDSNSVLATTGDNAILVSARFLTSAQLVALTERAIADLNAARG